MSIREILLGNPGADNALLATVDTGQSLHRILFDCGEGCLNSLKQSEIQSIEHLCFSHFHMDHVSGFDTFFRHNYNRPDGPVQVWGPEHSVEVMGNRFRSFTWNLHKNQPGEWIICELRGEAIHGSRFRTREAFAEAHELPQKSLERRTLFSRPEFRIEVMALPHHTIQSLAYRIVESDRIKICPDALKRSGLNPGKWLQEITISDYEEGQMIEVDGQSLSLKKLREDLLTRSAGESIAYLTDFCIEKDTDAWQEAVEWLSGTDKLVVECQYHSRDQSLADRNGHMTATAVGRLAADSKVGQVMLMHLSRRYSQEEWAELLAEVQAEFPRASFPTHGKV